MEINLNLARSAQTDVAFFWNDSWTNISYLGVAIAWSEIVNRLWSKWTSGTTRVKHIVLYNLKVVSSIPEVEWFQHKLGSLILPFKFYSHCVQLVPLKQPPGIRNWWPSTTVLICLVQNWHTKNIPDDPSLPSPADKFLWIGRGKKAEALSGRTLKNYDRKETLKIRSFFSPLLVWSADHQAIKSIDWLRRGRPFPPEQGCPVRRWSVYGMSRERITTFIFCRYQKGGHCTTIKTNCW